MADVSNKYPENVTGSFYCDDQCIDCDLCRETAPANFTRNDDGGHSYVFKQPETPEEEESLQGSHVRVALSRRSATTATDFSPGRGTNSIGQSRAFPQEALVKSHEGR